MLVKLYDIIQITKGVLKNERMELSFKILELVGL